MWNYEKRLQFPVKISKCNPKIAQQRYTMPEKRVGGLLTDIGREAPEMFQLRAPFFYSACAGSFQWIRSRKRSALRAIYAF